MLYPTELRAPAPDIASPRPPEQRRLRAAALALVGAAALATGAAAEEVTGSLERAGPVPVLRLADGRTATLAGVAVPSEPEVAQRAETAASAWLSQGAFELAALPVGPDRHGRVRALPARDDGTLETALVRDGLAIVAPDGVAPPEVVAALLQAEGEARTAHRGVWAADAHGPFDADRVPLASGRFVLVEGRIVRVARTTNYWYANFGRSIRRDFTVRVPPEAERGFEAAGVDLEGLEKRRVRVRGWLFEDNGPMIEVTQALAIEVLE